MHKSTLLACVILSLFTVTCSFSQFESSVKVGAEVLLEEHLYELEGKRVGLVMNPTARVKGSHMLDTLLASDVNVTALFAPEHGFRGDVGAGEKIEDGVDQATGLPVFSLYGETKKPTPEMLEKVDLLLFDMQDVGGRFYTYNVTLGNIISAAAPQDVPVWVLDRPNPAGGELISGWMMQKEHQSFVGRYPIPMVHGMTLGELAKMMVAEQWIKNANEAEVKVIPMKGWERSMRWRQTGLQWIPPSPNLPTFEHGFVYLGTVLFEGVNISEGRGTSDPFLKIGAPGTKLNSGHIARLRRSFSGINVERISFTPQAIPGKARHPDFEDERCHGVEIQITDPTRFDPVLFGTTLLAVMLDATPEAELNDFVQKLSGIDKKMLLDQLQEKTYLENWEKTRKEFGKQRSPYLLY
ncbi:exo-beta-N-acetylmuramidase NamZ family protein [Fodinibius halophilus]|uniref:DUF1343 domain-containing protein n=1 Tax=Fodinibius halophilus TaxID=1736908 RepID=A0A6M1T7H9_9BACT|nr:DUF1343 domain-containing protein [Fodinibius halophilus]NGP89335.1 DUF1343 domain-containing protein [Fodinibius halophilus]